MVIKSTGVQVLQYILLRTVQYYKVLQYSTSTPSTVLQYYRQYQVQVPVLKNKK